MCEYVNDEFASWSLIELCNEKDRSLASKDWDNSIRRGGWLLQQREQERDVMTFFEEATNQKVKWNDTNASHEDTGRNPRDKADRRGKAN